MGKNEGMPEYERRRLENINRNHQMLAKLQVHDLFAAAVKRQRTQIESHKPSPLKKKLKSESPAVLRHSLRTRGVPPPDDGKHIKKRAPLAMREAYTGIDGLDRKLIETLSYTDSLERCKDFETSKAINVDALQLKFENTAQVVPGMIMSLRFFPSLDMQMIVAGNKIGEIGFWNINSKKDDSGGIYLFRPHLGPVSEIVIDPISISKMYSSCYDGFIRMMDVEKEFFNMVYHSEYAIYSLSLCPRDTKSLYFSEGTGRVNKWDGRAGKSVLSCKLHKARINTIDCNENTIATSSGDGTACIWDLRYMNANKLAPLTTVSHERSVQSAYFSPTGKILATTSLDDKVGFSSGDNYENTSMVYHYNQGSTKIFTLRGVWGWDDSSIYIGSKRGIDVISVPGEKVVATLESDLVPAIQGRCATHPYNVGMLASTTDQGQVCIWSPS